MSSILNKINIDILRIIINFLGNFIDFKRIRLISKIMNEKCMNLWKSLKVKKETNRPRATFVCVNRCCICDIHKKENELTQIFVDWQDFYVCPVYIICGKLQCVHDFTMSYLSYAWENNIIILKKNSLPKKSIIPRSNKEIITVANISEYVRLSKNLDRLVTRAIWSEDNQQKYKDILINKLQGPINIKLLIWYKNLKRNSNNFNEEGINLDNLKQIINEKS